MIKLVEKITDLLDDEPLMDVILACASAAAFSIKELPAGQREHARQAVHELIDAMLNEWTPPK
jgi:uncharacterized membrane protein YccC